MNTTPDIIEEKLRDAKERGIEFVYQKPVAVISTISAEEWLRDTLTTIYQRGRESKEQEYGDLTICNRKNVHTCRLNAIHVPDNYLGKLRHLTSPDHE